MGDLGLIPGLGRSPGEGKGYTLHYSGLENSMDCIVHRVTKNQRWLSNFNWLEAILTAFDVAKTSPLFMVTSVWQAELYVLTWAYTFSKDKTANSGAVLNKLPAIQDSGWFLVSERSPGEENGNSLQYSSLGNPMDRGTWWTTVHGVTKHQTRLSNWAHRHTFR